MRLYDFELDENAYKIRLLLAFLDLDYEKHAVDIYPGQEHKSEEFLKLSPRGELPALEDGGTVFFMPEAILTYLALKYDKSRTWLPTDAETMSAVVQWLAFAAADLRTARTARHAALFDMPHDEKEILNAVRTAFRILERHLTHRQLDGKLWLATDLPSIADIAVFPSFALSRDFGIDHGEYPALRRWLKALRDLEGFIPMPGVPGFH